MVRWSIIRCIFCLVVLQEDYINYDETFSHMAKMTTMWTLITVVANRGWSLFQIDVKNAFLLSALAEEVYMQQLTRHHFSPQLVCHLHRAIYRLKQVSCS